MIPFKKLIHMYDFGRILFYTEHEVEEVNDKGKGKKIP